ncbi:hypothetical protein F7734_51920 [Scytonema sp. UIC 10036]|uniref:hypothetical protein n=1 Tax=Scytonema sp. UIC 10036 TaxID=2304196 RepID=UPI0012DA0734|nr:hypothetical protein [Scytonema sp. UIC 10036]MUH00334.1 hypothetical protein [Scytonema sp. UIC 10036]
MTVGRRNNPDYLQISGLIEKSLALKFKAWCAAHQMQLTEAMEEAIQDFLDKKSKEK